MSNFSLVASPLVGVSVVQPRRFEDDRGWFSETYVRSFMANSGFQIDFVQDNHSLSRSAGTLRGLHYQLPPFAQDKLVRVVRGRIWDVAVDVRRSSPTFGRWFGLELSAENQTQLLIPIGFAHGFVTLEEYTEVVYKVSSQYNSDSDAGVVWNDPDLKIDWPMVDIQPLLSAKDQVLPRLKDAILFD